MRDARPSLTTHHLRPGLLPLVLGLGVLLVLALLPWSIPDRAYAGPPFSPGDLVVGLGSSPDGSSRGELRHFSPDGVLLNTLLTSSGSYEETGACFDSHRRLYSTNFEANSVSKFHSGATLAVSEFKTNLLSGPNSCTVDADGNILVGLSDAVDGGFGGGGLMKLSPAGSALGNFQPLPDQRGTDWIDLAADQCSVYYTSLGGSIKKFDVCHNQQLPDFCTSCDDGHGGATFGFLFGLRLLPDGGVLVADWNGYVGAGRVRRYDSFGGQVWEYTAANFYPSTCGETGDQPCFFPWAVVLDPDLTSFWTNDYISGEVFRFDLRTGELISSFQAGICDDEFSACAVTGLAMVGEPTAAAPPFAAISVTATITADSKVYDGNTVAVTTCTLSGVVPGDDVQCEASDGAFDTKNVGDGKTVTATITLTGDDASIYTVAPQATTAADITPAPASVTPTTASKTYGDADPTLIGTTTGFVAADGITATYSRTAGETVAGSPYAISATLSPASALSNYAITYHTAAFTITKATASVTPNAATKTFGAMDPALTGVLSGFLAGDGVTATYTRTLGESVAGGPYIISAVLSPAGALNNYAISYNTAGFTITPAAASVTPNGATKTYGTADPVLTGTLSGFLSGVTATYSRTVGENVAGSPYAITAVLSPPSALSDYTITYNTAAFTITPATPVVTWANPADISYPTPLSGTQLNATASVPGSLAYTPPAGTVLSVGNGQPLNVLLTPTDSSNYTTATAQVQINVLPTDVGVVQTTPTPVIYVGDTAAYQLVVTGNGQGSSSNVVLTDVLPVGLDWTVSGPDAGACSIATPAMGTPTLTCSFGSVPPGATRNITLSSVTTTTGCGDVANTATVSSTGDLNDGNNTSATVTITVNCPAIAISKSTSTPSVMAGDAVSYKIVVTAGGSGDSTNVVMTDALPAGLTWSVSGADADSCAIGAGVLTCNYGTMPPLDRRTVFVNAVTTAANCGTILNSATVTDALDIAPGDNSAGPVAIVVNCPDVSVAVSAAASAITAGTNAVYNVVVTDNTGTATNVILSDVLPSGLTWTVSGASASFCTPSSPMAGGTSLNCNFGTLAAGTTRTITLTAATTTANCGVIKNTASVSATGDTNSSNNSSGPVSIGVACPVPPSVTNVSLSCPKVSLTGANLMVSGDIDPGSSTLVSILYTSPSGATTTHMTTSVATGEYTDSLVADQVGKWKVRATAEGVQSTECSVIVYGKSQGGTFVIGDVTPGATIHATADFWGSQWWKDNVWSGPMDPGVASLKGYLDAVDLPANCGGSWSTRPGNSSKPPATVPEYLAVVISSSITKTGPTIAGDVVAEVIVKVSPGYGPAPGHDGFGEIVAVRCVK